MAFKMMASSAGGTCGRMLDGAGIGAPTTAFNVARSLSRLKGRCSVTSS